ncbi:pentapeptide repeat-containing protein [Aetokthonos hydrillicola Thurmond2011]|jgi:uncharacterized protein YjbI with pentapeptide repeats/predicted GTPase|uniref:Pentapeptide repeat-containing protein n=1 Tax=Aetokthonos hydrillicola Thurmond2011 TaxID=2712845 RepID=A0AAP5MBE4_9CYAN|nr:pentapeptide repeat-containing protein [Aetokthonos hydrillicola]MBO3458922.1 hypothetical protein [Aetokthonos hydrillicola CCALA 1050]MBW4587227.1 pentapeptide repeat-containing protein [Aetokthonos hydrillicola CCALA 1050]MDR9896749.1 pentapeptide repeat-containing protein [Aetokthonos hydrillicola Thurmond2011]
MSNQDLTIGKEIKEVISNIKIPNVAILGRTGVGKSTLINAVFGTDLAKVGAGLPITQDFIRYPRNNEEIFPVVVYDSPGYEAIKELEWVERVIQFLEDKSTKKLEERIHLIWYVINASSARVEYFEREILNKLTQQHVPAVIVLSQCDRATPEEISGIETALEEFKLKKIYSVIKTSAQPLKIRGRRICQPFGLKELVDKTVALLPKIYSEAIVVAQIVDLRSKRQLAWQYIAAAASTCFTAGFIPITGVTPAAAIASQVTLCIKIASIYGYADFAYFLSTVGTFRVSLLSNIFLTATLDLLSAIFPPSHVLSGGVAATFITVIGLTYASVFEKLAKSRIYVKGKQATEEFLKTTFRQEFEKYLSIRILSKKDLKIVEDIFLDEAKNTESQENLPFEIETIPDYSTQEKQHSQGVTNLISENIESTNLKENDRNTNHRFIPKPRYNRSQKRLNTWKLNALIPFLLILSIAICLSSIQLLTQKKSKTSQEISRISVDKSHAKSAIEKLVMEGKTLANIDLSRANLIGANLKNANLSYANLSYANLSYANLNGSNLIGAELKDANLRYADLSYADLSEINLDGADIKNANLKFVKNLTPSQIKSATNWDKAEYNKDFFIKLGIKSRDVDANQN